MSGSVVPAIKRLKKRTGVLCLVYWQMIINRKKKRGMAMADDQGKWRCAHCGYTGNGRFEGDICPVCGKTASTV